MSWNDWQGEGNVIAMNKRDGAVWRTLDCLPPPQGTAVVGPIDWDPRYRMMRIVEKTENKGEINKRLEIRLVD